MPKTAYAKAGVDLSLSNRVKGGLARLLKSAMRPEVLGSVGGFGGLFGFKANKYKQPVLVSSVDGVGTKLKIAFAMNRHDTIGQCLVNHCVDDIAVLGAEPLFFLDYLGTGVLKPNVFESIIAGFAKGCAECEEVVEVDASVVVKVGTDQGETTDEGWCANFASV